MWDQAKLVVDAPSVIEVITQQQIEGGGYVDLVLQSESKFLIAVEVKVKSPENSDHHRDQLRNYRRWLNGQNKTDGYLFTLVRNPDKTFGPEQFGVNARRSWWDLSKHLQNMSKTNDLSDSESSLIKNLCEYLESEGIVSTYEARNLLDYAAGVKARKAVTGIFNQLDSRLQVDGFETVSEEGNKDRWPLLRIQHPQWKRIFGNGKNWKISLWFCVPGIWGADKHDFHFNIILWKEDHGNDWQHIKSRLSTWLSKLESQKFGCTVCQTGSKEREITSKTEIQLQPKYIYAWDTEEKEILNQNQPPNEDNLISLLGERTKQYGKIVDSLDA